MNLIQPTQIGNVNWNDNDLINAYYEMKKIYHLRPFKDNGGGMKIPHLVPCWHYLTKINPSIIIESGIYRSGGTWLFKQANPNATMFSIDIHPHNIRWRNEDGIYLYDDITSYDWTEKFSEQNIKNISDTQANDTLLFFGDHITPLDRIKWIKENTNFKKIMFEDNYPILDTSIAPKFTTLKQIFDNPLKIKDKNYLKSTLKTYYEYPPIYIDVMTRWNTKWEKYPTKQPLFNELPNKDTIEYEEFKDYTWICYIELN